MPAHIPAQEFRRVQQPFFMHTVNSDGDAQAHPTKLIQQDDDPFATHGIPIFNLTIKEFENYMRVSYVRKNGEFISEFCAVTTFSVS